MRTMWRSVLATVVAVSIAFYPTAAEQAVFRDVRYVSEVSYSDIFDRAADWQITEPEARAALAWFETSYRHEVGALEKEKKQAEQQLKRLEEELAQLNRSEQFRSPDNRQRREELHKEIKAKKASIVLLEQKIRARKVLFENQRAKVELALTWPAKQQENLARLADGSYRKREFADVESIGFRAGFEKQEHDVRWGQRIWQELQSSGQVPPELVKSEEMRVRELVGKIETLRGEELEQAKRELYEAQIELSRAVFVYRYIQRVVARVAAASDVKVPIQLHVVWDDDPNAFALPGGIVVINTGMLYSKLNQFLLIDVARAEQTEASGQEFRLESESELAGLVAHELVHISRRHARRLEKHANVLSLIAQTGMLVLLYSLGGPVGIGTYYLTQAILFGASLAIAIELLGVSRDSEREADVIGAQTAWNAGYDPSGFVRLFDRMANRFGYVLGASWFRTHPPSMERMVAVKTELTFLPAKEAAVVDTKEFQDVIETVRVLRESRMRRLLEERRAEPIWGLP